MRTKRTVVALACATLLVFGLALFADSVAWARAGGGMSSGSRGGRSFSSPSMPSRPMPSSPSPSSPGMGAPGRSYPGMQPSTGGWFGRSPFLQGMAGGLAGGLLGSMLFGGRGYATPGMAPGMAGGGGGGLPILDLLILGLIGYFVYRYFKRRKAAQMAAGGQYYMQETYDDGQRNVYYDRQQDYPPPAYDAVEEGFRQIRVYDPGFNEESFKETAQDLFFRIQAVWMNRNLQGSEGLFTPEMAGFFRNEFERMKSQGVVNRLENIAIRKVEPSEAWQEPGKDYITVLFTANLLDYTVNDRSGEVVSGDKMNPVKFQEFWTFTRDIGTQQWRLGGINQMADVPMRN